MKRKIIWFLIFFGMIFFGVGTGIWRNLNNSAYYYASHMPYRRDYYPVVGVIGYKPLPESVNRVYQSNINYDIKNDNVDGLGESGGVERNNVFKKGDEFSIEVDTASYEPDKKDDDKFMMAEITDSNKLRDREGIKIKYDYSKVDSLLKDLTRRIKKATKKPKVNLQFLYNWIFM